MIYRIKEKFWGLGNNFNITDDQDQPCYFVDGKWLSMGKKLSFQDMEGKELAFIQQKLFSWRPCYHILVDGVQQAEMRKGFKLFGSSFTIDVPGPESYTVDGSFWAHEFTFSRSGRPVAQVSKKVFAWTDSYSVNVNDDQDPVLILCCCIIIDQILHDGKKRN